MHLAHLGYNTADRNLGSRLHTRVPIIELCIVPGKRIECVLYGLRDAVKMVAALKRKQQPTLAEFFRELSQSGVIVPKPTGVTSIVPSGSFTKVS